VPVPGCAVDQDLTVFHIFERDQADDGCGQAEDAGDEMDGMGPGKDVKGVATVAAGLEAESLKGELMPRKKLPCQKK